MPHFTLEAQENGVVRSFRIKPSDWQEVERLAAIYRVEPSRLVRTFVLFGIEDARASLDAEAAKPEPAMAALHETA